MNVSSPKKGTRNFGGILPPQNALVDIQTGEVGFLYAQSVRRLHVAQLFLHFVPGQIFQHTIVHVQSGAVEAADVRENGQSVEKANQPVQPECGRDHKHHRQPSTAPYAIVRPVPFARTIHHVREAEFGRIAPLATLEQQLVIHAADQCRAERHDENVLDQFQHVGQDNATQTLTLVVLVDVEEKFVQIIYMLPSAASILGRHDHLVRLERLTAESGRWRSSRLVSLVKTDAVHPHVLRHCTTTQRCRTDSFSPLCISNNQQIIYNDNTNFIHIHRWQSLLSSHHHHIIIIIIIIIILVLLLITTTATAANTNEHTVSN
ncbi:hypothetical protein T4E_8457 [Trichinella pseudospiralis]|uniref:Uncharacterized protein n=1 Tax=Trichinella pseudospiralis TaxID=6337 RepID=A0A0V0XF31_TRIPS|nr:hypothetical protein T4E_8457 [Trichinella pseudospiralis]